MTDFTLPELGENITTGDVLRVLVKPGDRLAKDQPVLELETDKATIEVPSSVAGQIKDVKVKAGDKVKVGQAILSVEEDGAQAQTDSKRGEAAAEPPSPPKVAPPAGKPRDEQAVGANTKMQIPEEEPGLEQHVEGTKRPTGDKPGTKKEAPADEQKKEQEEEQEKEKEQEKQEEVQASDGRVPRPFPGRDRPAESQPRDRAAEGQAQQPEGGKVVDISRGARAAAEPAPEMPPAPAAPSVRRMARELGVDINEVQGSGPDGRISTDDVKAHAKRLVTDAKSGARPAAGVALPDFSRWGEIERQPLRAVRRKTAEHLSAAWATIPHVTQNDVADITGLEELRKRFAKQAETAGGQLTVTAIAVKVVAAALKVFPQFNSSIDLAANELVFKKYVNIGVAVDTDRGLLVPVIRDADAKNIIQISVELAKLAEKARTRKIALDEMQGGTFSISNLGGIGGTFFTPIVNAPEVAILGISRARMEPVWNESQFVARFMLPLSLSYDHRVIDGADGIRFLRWVVEALEQPFLLALHG